MKTEEEIKERISYIKMCSYLSEEDRRILVMSLEWVLG